MGTLRTNIKTMRKIILFSLSVLFFSQIALSQTATKIEFFNLTDNRLQCGTALKLGNIYQSIEDNPNSRLYVIYYESQYRATSVYDDKTKKFIPKLIYPRFGDALNKAKEIPLYLKNVHKFPTEKIILIDGGFRQSLELEIWIVPNGAEIPKATPALERKDIKYAKGKPYQTKDLAKCYSNY